MKKFISSISRRLVFSAVFSVAAFSVATTSQAQTDEDLDSENVLEEVIVTATKRAERIQDVPISIAALSGERLESKFSGGETILALAGAVPGLYAESSNGRHGPRFYMRGLGNADFDAAASQPVSIVFDDVAMEQLFLKTFPVFDMASVEVIRGPQGTLFGRNTTAGIIKVNSRRPTNELEGYARGSVGNLNSYNFEGAVGGALIDGVLSARASILSQNRGDWIDNAYTGLNNAIGGHNELAGRVQLLWTPTDDFSALLLYQQRKLRSRAATAFRANIITPGTNKLNGNFVRDKVWFDGGGRNPADLDGYGATLKLDWDLDNFSITSITSYQDAEQFGRGDIDGGIVDPTLTIEPPDGLQCVDAPFVIPIFGPARTCPDFIFISSDTGGYNFTNQFSQELRFASNTDGAFRYQVGAFFFDDELETSTAFGIGPGEKDVVVAAIALHKNKAWAIFGQGDYDFNDKTTLTVGIRYSDDEKNYIPIMAPPTQEAISLTDDNVSWNITVSHKLDDASMIYGRVATGFRAPSIQARNAAFGGPVTVADSETILSYEIGYKADLADRVRLNTAVFYYEIDDMQLTAIGGGGNFTTLLNAKGGTGQGMELDIEFLATDKLILSGGFGYNDTEINDPNLSVTPGIGARTVLDPINEDGNALIDGNPFQHAPKWTLNLEASYVYPLDDGHELYFYTDWKVKGDTNEFLYESVEFQNGTQFEGGLRFGYRDKTRGWEVAAFGRNITDEENLIGGIDFSNTTGYVNEPRLWGIEAQVSF